MASKINSLLKVILPKRFTPAGVAQTPTFQRQNPENVLTLPGFKDHLSDIFSTRQASDSRTLMKSLFVHDPDVSAAVSAYLSVANTAPVFLVKDANGLIDRKGQLELNQIINAIVTRYDYSTGFQLQPSLRSICENMRYMVLLRGTLAAELIFDKTQTPVSVRLSDAATLEWNEKISGSYKPTQKPVGSDVKIPLDIASYFVTFYRRDPTSIYTTSAFVSAINTVAARQQVINDLYRIMRFTGFPRIEATVMEEVLRKNAPATVREDAAQLNTWVATQIQAISGTLSDLRADQAFVHTDSVEVSILNDKSPGASMNVENIISTLNAQNQAGLRAMSTILGRGESGVNTASVEARLFAMSAEEINEPVGDIWSQMLTMALRLRPGFDQSSVECRFQPAEMRSALELEPQLLLKSSRLRQDLSDGIISDDEYHLEMYGRIRPDESPILSGTGFMTASATPDPNPTDVSPNTDPLGRSLAAPGGKAAGGNAVKKTPTKPK